MSFSHAVMATNPGDDRDFIRRGSGRGLRVPDSG
jgi:hypothetical protein